MVLNRDKKESIFRQESLERLSSPERLDQLMQVISPMDWLAAGALCGLVAIGVVWSIVGRIPVTVEGRGVFMSPHRLVDFQSTIPGQLKSIEVRKGQCVQKDALLATINPIELRQQLQLAQQKLAQLQLQAQSSGMLSEQRLETERRAIAASRASLQQRLGDTQALTPVLKTQGLEAVQEKRRSLEQRLQDAQRLVPVMQKRLNDRQALQAEGAIPRDSVLQVEQEFIQARQTVVDIEAQLRELTVQSTQTQRQYLENLRAGGDLQAQLQELDTRSRRLDQENLESKTLRTKEMQEVTREVARLEQQIANNSRIVSPQAGCILEVNSTVGQVVQPGTRLGNMQVVGQAGTLMGISYFAVKDGKQIKPGMTVTITPETVQRERFGGVVGKVIDISPMPITKEGAVSTIGNAEMVQTLLGAEGTAIEVVAQLEADSKNASGYKWSASKGPDAKITSGTTAAIQITTEERAPITFVLPFLRELLGMK